MSVELASTQDVQRRIADRFKARRLAMNLTQERLAERSGVSWGSLKRFELTGLIALESLLRLALVLDCLDDFAKLGARDNALEGVSLDALLSAKKTRQRATRTSGARERGAK